MGQEEIFPEREHPPFRFSHGGSYFISCNLSDDLNFFSLDFPPVKYKNVWK
jgi:hypothetical protein